MARARSSGNGGKGGTGSGGSGASGADVVLKFNVRSLTVMRGTEANAYGDESDVGTILYMGIQAAIAETSDVAFNAATQRQEVVRGVTARVPAWADILTTDTLMDETTGLYYMIDSIEAQPGIGFYPAPKILTLKERSGISTASD